MKRWYRSARPCSIDPGGGEELACVLRKVVEDHVG